MRTETHSSPLSRREYFDNLAQHWNDDISSEDDLFLQRTLNIVETPPELGKRLLDIGCGTGILFKYLEHNDVIALDISSEMLRRAHQKGARHVIEYVHADAHKLPFLNDSFARVVMMSVFPHFDHPSTVLEETLRVLKPKGILSLIHLKNPAAVNQIHTNVGGAIAHDRLPEIDELKTLIQRIGFEMCHMESNHRMVLICRKPSL